MHDDCDQCKLFEGENCKSITLSGCTSAEVFNVEINNILVEGNIGETINFSTELSTGDYYATFVDFVETGTVIDVVTFIFADSCGSPECIPPTPSATPTLTVTPTITNTISPTTTITASITPSPTFQWTMALPRINVLVLKM